MRSIWGGLCLAAVSLGCGPAEEPQPTPGGGGRTPGTTITTSSYSQRAAELTGGTLTVSATGETAIVSYPDRDQVVVLNLDTGSVLNRVTFTGRSRPGVAAVDGNGDFVVALRGLGEVVTFSSRNGGYSARRKVCSEPTGLAWDAANEALLVACATGELVTLPDGASTPSAWVQPGLDLRDVVVTPAGTWVTTFRSASLVRLGADQTPGLTQRPPSNAIGAAGSVFEPRIAWRTRPLANGGLVMVHQRHVSGDIAAIQPTTAPTTPAYYTNNCTSPIVRSAVTVFQNDGAVQGSFEVQGALPVDIAVSPDGASAALVLAGARRIEKVVLNQGLIAGSGTCSLVPSTPPLRYQPIAAAYRPNGELVVQSHEPPELVVYPAPGSTEPARHYPYGEPRPEDPSYEIFHATVGGLACASCHPEGRDDGHTWTFTQGKVRTQSLAGGLSQTAPYHWNGRLADIGAIMGETFVLRMGGSELEASEVQALATWMDGIPAPGRAAVKDAEMVGRGKTLFSGSGGCTACHSGTQFTNAATVDVGTGGRFQVPGLKGLRTRGPWMHDGCATRLAERFSAACGGDIHGSTANLTGAEVQDLVSYLESL
jgi:hypothetical protein